MSSAILALNAGSSSIKFALFPRPDAAPSVRGELEEQDGTVRMTASSADLGPLVDESWGDAGPDVRLHRLLDWVEAHLGADRLAAVGHRIVHGGLQFRAPVRLTSDVLAQLSDLTPLAPLHQPGCLAPVHAIAAARPALPQVGCFDTAFHATLPELAWRYALPRDLDSAIRVYGFHGLSYEHIARQLRDEAPALAAGRVVVAHLGNGASLCAMQDGRSVDTTMGFSALEGLVMGTRCGALDSGVLLYLLQEKGLDAEALQTLLYRRSGLLGVSGIAADVRSLTGSHAPEAAEALDLFCFRAAKLAAGMAASLGGLDGIVFTGGIGEHAPAIRAAICARLEWFGVALDPLLNARGVGAISTPGSTVAVRVIPADEEASIARHTAGLLDMRTAQ